jgi:hypothetical protein
MLDLKLIRTDGGTQSRVKLNEDIVAEYAEAYAAGATFPAVTVFFDGSDRWLADGFHRFFGAKKAGKKTILENIIPGTLRDAKLFSFGANGTHGQRPTNADKRKAVEEMLADAEWAQWSDRKIAEVCLVTHPFVAGIRNPKVVTVTTQAPKKEAEKVVTVTTPAAETLTPPKAVEPEPEDFGPDADEIASMEAAQAADVAAMGKLFEADDKLGAAFAEIKRLNAEVSQLRLSRDGYMNKSNELISTVKSLQRKLERAQKATA